uniref:Peptidase M12A domain-containing protein n=1 Tax=Syphacia muris TaxID=451379 RepID=A0A0N5AGM4_9BILA
MKTGLIPNYITWLPNYNLKGPIYINGNAIFVNREDPSTAYIAKTYEVQYQESISLLDYLFSARNMCQATVKLLTSSRKRFSCLDGSVAAGTGTISTELVWSPLECGIQA